MNKRLEKRHKRQVTRARERVKVSAPDLRTPEQLKAVREASRALVGHGSVAPAPYAVPQTQTGEES
jgi:hypothetical protein